MILGDLLQQCYNIAAPLIVGQFLVHRRRDGASERHCLPSVWTRFVYFSA